jgi:hypothetical protein
MGTAGATAGRGPTAASAPQSQAQELKKSRAPPPREGRGRLSEPAAAQNLGRTHGNAMLSVVIGTRDSGQLLLATLAALVPGAAAALVREVIVADGGSSDDTAEIADAAGCRIMMAETSLGARLAAAAGGARAPWLLFLQPGSVPDPSWIEHVARFMQVSEREGRADRCAAVFRPVARNGTLGPSVTDVLRLAFAALMVRPTPQQGLLINRSFYDAMGGHRAESADCEADLLRAIGRRRIALLGCAIVRDR